MFISIQIAVCLAAAASLFGMWTATLARANNPSAPGNPFNGSAAAVCALWLFVNIWLVNVFRAKKPQLAIPVIMYTIFASTIFSNGALYDMTRTIKITVLLLKAFTTGFAISLAVGLLIFPANCREIWWKILGGYLQVSRALLREQVFISSLHQSSGATRLLRLSRNPFCNNTNLCRPTIYLHRVKKKRTDHTAKKSLFQYDRLKPFRRPTQTSMSSSP